MTYDDDITAIKGIGEKTKKLLEKLGVRSVGDLLEFYPREYDVFDRIIPIDYVREGQIVTVAGYINNMPRMHKTGRLDIITLMLRDETGSIHLTWFNMPFLKSKLKIGSNLIVRGKVVVKNGFYQIDQPEILSKEQYYSNLNKMKPIYPLTKGLSNKIIQKAVGQALTQVELDKDFLSVQMRKKYDVIEYKKAIKQIHFPDDRQIMLKARKRIVFDEFLIFSMALRCLKEGDGDSKSDYVLKDSSICHQFIDSLPYNLTGAQLRTWNEIKTDMSGGGCMNRLVQGDVGSGKTVVAMLALLMAVDNGYQGIMMAPTEVLAKQHFESFTQMFFKYNINIVLLTGSMTAKEKRVAKEQISSGQADIIIGTHALIQDDVEYYNPAVVVTDEQHRFGVRQRKALAGKGRSLPHMLVMSATPIPRTLAIIMYGDLDISVIDEMPKERQHIKNCVVTKEYRKTAYDFIRKEIESGRQAYVICPMVETNEEIQAESVVDYATKLRQVYGSSVLVEYLHGRMKGKQKNDIMERFSNGEIQILVSTTVIEVGVNVPNATVILIENADRFGLAQLHQIRGRVGRGKYQSYCIMINSSESDNAAKRLDILNQSDDGFYIASKDLSLRGPGELFGTIQSGELVFKLGDMFNDAPTLKLASDACKDFSSKEFEKIMDSDTRVGRIIQSYSDKATL